MYFRDFYSSLTFNALHLIMPFHKNLLSCVLVCLKLKLEEENLENTDAF